MRAFPQLPPASIHSLPGPDDITRAVLPNGVVVLARPNFNSPSVFINGSLLVGSLFDPDEKLGLADFTASALMRGTVRRDFQQVYDALESVGASLGYSSGTHTTGFSGKALAEDLDMLLELLVETLLQPVFPAAPVERLRAQILTSLAIRAQDTAEMASLAFDQLVYPGHPYSRPEEGNPETIQTIILDDLLEFHRLYYGPRGMVIALVGGVEPQVAVEKITRALGEWQNPGQPVSPPLPPLSPLAETATRRVTISGKVQADIIMGVAGPARRDTEYLAASLGNHILGQFGMFGRIGEAVRQQAGLAYYAYSSLGGGLGPSPWEVSAGVDPSNVDRVIELIRAEIARFVSEPVSGEELADSQTNYIGRLPLSLESNSGVAGALLNLERYELGLDYYRRYIDLVNAITPQEILEAAQRYLHPDRLAVAVAGP
jgi:zinc protease